MGIFSKVVCFILQLLSNWIPVDVCHDDGMVTLAEIGAGTTGPVAITMPMLLKAGARWVDGDGFEDWHLVPTYTKNAIWCNLVAVGFQPDDEEEMHCFEEETRHYFWPKALLSTAKACRSNKECLVPAPVVPDSSVLISKERSLLFLSPEILPQLNVASANCAPKLPQSLSFTGPGKKAFWVKSVQVQLVGRILKYKSINHPKPYSTTTRNVTVDLISKSGCRDLIYGLMDVE